MPPFRMAKFIIINRKLDNPIKLIPENIISLFDVFKYKHTTQDTTATP